MDKKYGNNINIRLKAEIYDLLKALAEKKDLPMTIVARKILTEYLKKISKTDIIPEGE